MCLSVSQSVCLSITRLRHENAQKAERIEVLFGMETQIAICRTAEWASTFADNEATSALNSLISLSNIRLKTSYNVNRVVRYRCVVTS